MLKAGSLDLLLEKRTHGTGSADVEKNVWKLITHVNERSDQILQAHAGSQASYGEQHGTVVRPSEERTCFRPAQVRRKAIEIDGARDDTDDFLWNSILPVQQLREYFGENDGS